MGKTSILVRVAAHARAQQGIIVDFNFQMLDEHQLETLERLLRYLADAIHERLRLATSPDVIW